jgi:hypothetical protein
LRESINFRNYFYLIFTILTFDFSFCFQLAGRVITATNASRQSTFAENLELTFAMIRATSVSKLLCTLDQARIGKVRLE